MTKKEKTIQIKPPVRATYSINRNSTTSIFQIDTYGTESRERPETSSQMIAFDLENLKELVHLISREFPSIYNEIASRPESTLVSFEVPLLDDNGTLQYCFRWGFQKDGKTLRDNSRTGNEAYLQLPPNIYKSDFYPVNPQKFTIKTDDGKELIFVRAQKDDAGQALETTDDAGQEGNKELGKYIRFRLGIESGKPITKEDILNYGNDKILLSKDSDGHFFLSFKPGIKFEKQPLILYGPPGTGKTFKMQNDYIAKFSESNRFVTTFHQSFSYEEFVEGLKPILDGENNDDKISDVKYRIEKGVFYNACERAAELAGYAKVGTKSALQKCIEDSERSTKMKNAIRDKNVVLLCIDEINRANVSAVFGDLISLIEPSKRIGAKYEMAVQLPYSKEKFAVPANLMIVGTMNTADRSIQLLDSALRRRFHFEELLPEYDVIKNETARKILESINLRIRCFLDKDHQIGHSYFIDSENDLDVFNTIRESVIPLLEEYFYNDSHKVRRILNEENDSENNFYVKDSEANEILILNDSEEDEDMYKFNPELDNVKDEVGAKRFIEHIYG